MLVITDQCTCCIGRKRSLASARKPKEHGGTAISADIGRGVHGQNALARQQIVHHTENRLLGFTGIAGATNDDQFTSEVENDKGGRIGTVHFGIGAESRCVNDRKTGLMAGLLSVTAHNKHIAGESTMPGQFIDNTYRQAPFGVRTGKAILHVQLAAL